MSSIRILTALIWFPILFAFVLQSDSCRRSNMPGPPATKSPPAESTQIPDSSPNMSNEVKGLPLGTWAGPGIQLTVTEGGGSLEYDCAHGTIEQRVMLDANGAFDLKGTYESETGGPSQISIAPEETASGPSKKTSSGYQARYSGKVTGQTMTLSVTLNDRRTPVGTFKLAYGAPSKLRKCI
jgi:hypothetical protein